MSEQNKGIIGYEQYMGMYTLKSFTYFRHRMDEVKETVHELEKELSELFYKFSHNIDKEKKLKLLKGFAR